MNLARKQGVTNSTSAHRKRLIYNNMPIVEFIQIQQWAYIIDNQIVKLFPLKKGGVIPWISII
jgi:hypothetical protein